MKYLRIVSASIFALTAAIATQSYAASCEGFSSYHEKFDNVTHEIITESLRVSAITPMPYRDAGMCKAAQDAVDVVNYFLAFDPGCFPGGAADIDDLKVLLIKAQRLHAAYHC